MRKKRFNEAAARCRGKPAAPAGTVARVQLASMRPRPDAAENIDRAGLPGAVVMELQ